MSKKDSFSVSGGSNKCSNTWKWCVVVITGGVGRREEIEGCRMVW